MSLVRLCGPFPRPLAPPHCPLDCPLVIGGGPGFDGIAETLVVAPSGVSNAADSLVSMASVLMVWQLSLDQN